MIILSLFMIINNDSGQKFKRSKILIRMKMLEYVPALFISNLATLLILSADGIVVGNFIGADALASVNIFYPVTLIMGVISAIASYGTATCLSTYIVKNDVEALSYKKSAIKFAVIITAILIVVLEVPLVELIIASYNLEPTLHDMTMQYSVGMMIAMPFSLISSVGLCQLQIVGKMKILVFFAVLEGVINIVLDLLFVGVLKVGVGGAGYGTACANIIRAVLTTVYLYTKTDIYKNSKVKCRIEDIIEIIRCGLPEATSILVKAFQSYVLMRIILLAFGKEGGSIKGVTVFCFTLTNIFISSIQGSIRPLISLLHGEEDRIGLKNTMRIGYRLITISCILMTILVFINPKFFYVIHGVHDAMPETALLALKLSALQYVFAGYSSIFRTYFSNTNNYSFATRVTLIGNLSIVAFAYGLYKFFPAPYVFLAETLTAAYVSLILIVKYFYFDIKNKNEELKNEKKLYLTVKHEDAIEASEYIKQYAKENGISDDIAYRVSLCMEEMVEYAVKSQKRFNLHTQIMISFNDGGAKFIMLDDGECIALNENEESKKLITNNYELLNKISKSHEYKYILNMNCTTFNF